MLGKCTFWVSNSLTRSTNPFTLRPSRSSFQTTRVSVSRKWDSASCSPGRSTCAPLSLLVEMRSHPALFSARPAAIPDSGPGSTPGRSNPHRLEVLPLATNSRYSYRRGRNEKNESRMVFENLKATFLEHHTHTRFSRRCPSKDRRVAGRGANTFTSPISP